VYSGDRDKAKDLLFEYSEWLDGQGLIVGPDIRNADERTHDQLVEDFLNATNSG
jgi:hypothetical protein